MDSKTLKEQELEKVTGGTKEADEQMINTTDANNLKCPFVGDATPSSAEIVSELKS